MNEMNHHQKLAKRLALLWAISYAAAGAISFVWTLVRYQNTGDYMIPILSAQHLFIQFILLLYLYPLLALVYHHSKRAGMKTLRTASLIGLCFFGAFLLFSSLITILALCGVQF